jgi:integrase
MPKRTIQTRIYWRGGRAYGDFRDFHEVGGTQERLTEPGDRYATTDPDTAARLLAGRLGELEQARRNRKLFGPGRGAQLAPYASEHLVAKAKSGRSTDRWLRSSELFLKRAVDYFGAGRELASIDVGDVRGWGEHLAATGNGRAGGMTGGTVRHHLNTLSNLFRHAASERRVPTSYNPVRDLLDKPQAKRAEARWLEVHEAALLIESVKTYKPKRADLALPFLYPLVATYLLTGGRRLEVLGLEVADVNFERRTVTFRPNRWRRLKTETSHRSVPLHPQLEAILWDYLKERRVQEAVKGEAPRALLFPGEGANGEAMLTDFRKVLDGAAIRAGFWEPVVNRAGAVVLDKQGQPKRKSTVRSKAFRHTYCSTRLQTLDQGAPVSQFTVARELGHGGDALVRRIYGHLGEVRQRSEVVEYRIEQHEERLRDRLFALEGVRE